MEAVAFAIRSAEYPAFFTSPCESALDDPPAPAAILFPPLASNTDDLEDKASWAIYDCPFCFWIIFPLSS